MDLLEQAAVTMTELGDPRVCDVRERLAQLRP